MADAHGIVRSNTFQVKDVKEFRNWFEENCHFGSNVQFWEYDDNVVAFGGYEYYPSAYPRKPDEETTEWELEDFAQHARSHLVEGQHLRVLAVCNEKLRYASATHLKVTEEKVEYIDLFEGE